MFAGYCATSLLPPPRRSYGICLGNAQVYGSMANLRVALRAKRKLIVSRVKAKEHTYLKMCLITLAY